MQKKKKQYKQYNDFKQLKLEEKIYIFVNKIFTIKNILFQNKNSVLEYFIYRKYKHLNYKFFFFNFRNHKSIILFPYDY